MKAFVHSLIARLGTARDMRELVSGSSAALLVKILAVFCAFFIHVLLARWMALDQYGVLFFTIACIELLAIICCMGLPTAIIRLLGKYTAEQNWSHYKSVSVMAIGLVASASVAMAVTVTFLVILMRDHIGHLYFAALLAGVWLLPAFSLLTLFEGIARAIKRIVLAFAPGQIGRNLAMMLAATLAIMLGWPLSAFYILLLFVPLMSLIVLGQGLRVVWLVICKHQKSPLDFQLKMWLSLAFPMLLTQAANMLMQKCDLVMLGMLSEPDDVGLYNAASRLVTLVNFWLIAINAMALPMFADLYARGKIARLQKLVLKVNVLASLPAFVLCLLMILYAGPILSIFGHEFVEAQHAMSILLVGKLCFVLCGPCLGLMNMCGMQKQASIILFCALFINIGGNLVFIPAYGYWGASVVTAVTIAGWNFACVFTLYFNIGIQSSLLPWPRKH